MDAQLFKSGMRRLASGVSVVTTLSDDGPQGLVATAVTSVSADPPSLLVCVNRSGSSRDSIAASGLFCVNLLDSSHADIVASFGAGADRGARFSDPRWTSLVSGAPALDGALASFDCRLSQIVESGSHTIFIGDVIALELWQNQINPLIYVDGGFRSLAVPA